MGCEDSQKECRMPLLWLRVGKRLEPWAKLASHASNVHYWLPFDIARGFMLNAHQSWEQYNLLNSSLHTCPSLQKWLPVAQR